MVRLGTYQKLLRVTTIDELVHHFQDTLTVTNRSPGFYVDWTKVRRNVSSIESELEMWERLRSSCSSESSFRRELQSNVELIKTIPILLAIREKCFSVITDLRESAEATKELDFGKHDKSGVTESDIEDYVRFARDSGLLALLTEVRSFRDYVLGVEVGMDTNARKNRSGTIMEQLLHPLIAETAEKLGCTVYFQKPFESVALYGGVPSSLARRKTDFILFSDTRFINIEVNYYTGAGSKPEEIVDSYINRKNELKSSKWSFIWITDGDVWKASTAQLSKAFKELDYVLNIDFCQRGMLKEVLEEILHTEP